MEFEELNTIDNGGEISGEIPISQPIPQLTPEERRDNLLTRLKLKNKILTYQLKFKQELIAYDYKMQQLDELSNDDLTLFLEEIQIAVRQRNSSAMISSFYYGACNLLEGVSCKMGCDVSGFANAIRQQQEVQKCLDEISLQYEDNMFMPATVRLPYLTLQMFMSVYQFKKTDNIIEEEMKKPVDKKVFDEYSDL